MLRHETGENLYISEHTYPLLYSGGAVTFNAQNGRYTQHSELEGQILQIVNQTGSESAVRTHYETVEPPEVASLALDALHALQENHVLQSASEQRKPRDVACVPDRYRHTTPKPSNQGIRLETITISPARKEMARGAIEWAAVLLQRPFADVITSLQTIKDRLDEPATHREGLRAMAAVGKTALEDKVRLSPVHRSTAVVLLGGQRGTAIDLQFGAAVNPSLRRYVWPVADNRPLQLKGDPHIKGAFHPIFKV